MTKTLTLCTDEGDVVIRDSDLPLRSADLAKFRITAEELERCFAIGAELMRDVSPRDRVQPIAYEERVETALLDRGKRPDWGHRAERFERGQQYVWEVRLCGYSPLSDPLLNGPPAGRA
jgi:hypothetical protein